MARDAEGRLLRSRLREEGPRVLLEVDDSTASDAADGDRFGCSVAFSGDLPVRPAARRT